MLSKLAKQSSTLAVVVLLIPFAFAQTSSSKSPAVKTASASSEVSAEGSQDLSALPPIWVGPALHAPSGRLRAGTSNSYNWDGYVVTGTNFTSATGSWNVPATTCSNSPNSAAFFWVGIDGWTSTTVEQTGTAVICNKTTAT
jgi:hypothetical protein